MDIVRSAIAEVKRRINRHVLDKAFLKPNSWYQINAQATVEDQINTLVIRPRVMFDCNLVGGITALIPLAGLPVDRPANNIAIIKIPKERSYGKSIISVSNVNYYDISVTGLFGSLPGFGYSNLLDGSDGSAVMSSATSVLAALDNIPITSTSNVTLIGENTIRLMDIFTMPSNSVLRCYLENDENLANIQPRSWPEFFKLVEFATKAYIYNELIVDLDTSELQGGQALGVFKSIVESYSEAEQNYQDLLKSWRAVAFMNDNDSQQRFIKMLMGANR